MLTAIVSGKAAPGATTSAWALALSWPSDVLVVDADPAGGDMVAGLLAGRVQVDHGLLSWSAAARRVPAMEAAMVIGQHVVCLPEAPRVWMMPGFQNAAQAAALDSGGWERLSRALEREASVAVRDVLVDTGRLSDASCWPVIRTADRVLLTVGRSVRSIHAALNAASVLQSRLGDLASVSLLVVGSGPYDAAAIADEIGVPLAGELPEDRDAAGVLSDGAAAGVRGVQRSKLLKAARIIADQLVATTAQNGATTVGAVR
jgi:MinD-like ATPase involved in chromosome partitioning or flagellar assembly